MARILLLGGTSEASALAKALATAKADAVFSYAGRTKHPIAQPLPTRVGGFGGVEGLAAYLRAEAITHVVDATHPFAAQMSRNAVRACAEAGVALAAFERPAWVPGDGDNWRTVPDIPAACAALPEAPHRVFLAIGRQHLAEFARAPRHRYLLRMVELPDTPIPLPDHHPILGRGPFTVEADTALMREHATEILVAKNAGGTGARAKLDAARALNLPVILIDRPQVPARRVLGRLAEVLDWLGHSADRGV